MTTPQAAARYLQEHLHEHEGRPCAVYNPHNKPLEELPYIIGFNNGGQTGWLQAVAIAQDGTYLGSHICSHEGYMPADLGIIEGARPDRHRDDYQPHYPDGYRCRFVSYEAVDNDELLKAAWELNKVKEQQNTPAHESKCDVGFTE